MQFLSEPRVIAPVLLCDRSRPTRSRGRCCRASRHSKEKLMMNVRNIAALLALSALPACSMFGGGGRQASNTAPAPSQSYAYQQPQQQSYSSFSQSQELSPDTIK